MRLNSRRLRECKLSKFLRFLKGSRLVRNSTLISGTITFVMSDVYEKSLQLHKKHQGKLGTTSLVSVTSKQELALAYSPGVGAVSQAIAEDTSSERVVARETTLAGRTVAIISDGSAVLGLGNIGASAALPVMEGKALLIREFAGLDSFPLVIDTQDPDEIIKFVRQVAPTFCGVNLEDITAPKCFQVEEALQDLGIPVFHDDQHGTAIVVSAALKNAAKVVGKKFADLKVGVIGSGAAGLSVAKILTATECHSGVCSVIPNLEKVAEVVVFDRSGAIYEGRDGLNIYKSAIASVTNSRKLSGFPEECMVGFDVVVGVSGPGSISRELVQNMAKNAIVFALANPTPEIMPEEARAAGAAVVATGRSDYPNQINNVLAFPAIFKIARQLQLKQITLEVKLALADAIASQVSKPTADEVIPSAFVPDLVEKLTKTVVASIS